MTKILVKISPSGERMRIVEDGQLDLEALPFGTVVSRRRVGLINPSPKTPTRLEVAMLDETGSVVSVLEGEHKTKDEAVEAEQEEIKRRLMEESKRIRTDKKPWTPPSTGISIARCPICQHPLYLLPVNRKGRADTEFRCSCPSDETPS